VKEYLLDLLPHNVGAPWSKYDYEHDEAAMIARLPGSPVALDGAGMGANIPLDRVCASVTRVWRWCGEVLVEISTLNTPMGKMLVELWKHGIVTRVSETGTGHLRGQTIYDYDFRYLSVYTGR
jgi:hypothetical protein